MDTQTTQQEIEDLTDFARNCSGNIITETREAGRGLLLVNQFNPEIGKPYGVSILFRGSRWRAKPNLVEDDAEIAAWANTVVAGNFIIIDVDQGPSGTVAYMTTFEVADAWARQMLEPIAGDRFHDAPITLDYGELGGE